MRSFRMRVGGLAPERSARTGAVCPSAPQPLNVRAPCPLCPRCVRSVCVLASRPLEAAASSPGAGSALKSAGCRVERWMTTPFARWTARRTRTRSQRPRRWLPSRTWCAIPSQLASHEAPHEPAPPNPTILNPIPKSCRLTCWPALRQACLAQQSSRTAPFAAASATCTGGSKLRNPSAERGPFAGYARDRVLRMG